VSGPLLDRIDLHVDVPPVEFDQLSADKKAESSVEIRKRVNAARQIKLERFAGTGISSNSHITPNLLREFCVMTPGARAILKSVFEKLGLSARAYDRLLKVSRTIADLAAEKEIGEEHIAEAVQYRSLDRKYWQG
jgi:magnesium chelatase family protein